MYARPQLVRRVEGVFPFFTREVRWRSLRPISHYVSAGAAAILEAGRSVRATMLVSGASSSVRRLEEQRRSGRGSRGLTVKRAGEMPGSISVAFACGGGGPRRSPPRVRRRSHLSAFPGSPGSRISPTVREAPRKRLRYPIYHRALPIYFPEGVATEAETRAAACSDACPVRIGGIRNIG